MKHLDWNQLDVVGRATALARPPQTRSDDLREGVAQIIADVRARGDVALREFSAKYDGCTPDTFEVGAAELAAA